MNDSTVFTSNPDYHVNVQPDAAQDGNYVLTFYGADENIKVVVNCDILKNLARTIDNKLDRFGTNTK